MIARGFRVLTALLLLTFAIGPPQAAAQKHRVTASDLDRLVRDKRYPELQAQLPVAKLPPTEKAYFSGILADRSNHTPDAITALEQVLPELGKPAVSAQPSPSAPWQVTT